MSCWRLLSIALFLALLVGSGGAAGAHDLQQSSGAGCTNLDTAYDPDCDVDRSGKIDVQDLTLVAFHWGQEGVWTGPAVDGWSLTGNAGTDPTTHFLGTTDNVALEIRVNNQRALRIEPASDTAGDFSPNLIGGYQGNSVTSDQIGSTIGGGGRIAAANLVTASFATIGGGENNTASGRAATVGGGNGKIASGDLATVAGGSNNRAGEKFATVGGGIANEASGAHAVVPGGLGNTAAGDYSFAAGRRAKIDAAYDGAFLFADSQDFDFPSADANEFAVRATGGVRFILGIDNNGAPTWTCSVANGRSWSCSSDRNLKENLVAVDGRQVLERLTQVPVFTWNAKGQDPTVRHMGPMAQDFYAAFKLSADDTQIGTMDVDGVTLAAIRGLYQTVQQQQAQIGALQQQNADLEARLAALERAVGANGAPASAGQ